MAPGDSERLQVPRTYSPFGCCIRRPPDINRGAIAIHDHKNQA